MRLRIGLLAAVGLIALVPPAPAQAPARADAAAYVASGDFGDVGRTAVSDAGGETVSDSAARPGMEIGAGRTTVRATRSDGVASARAEAAAEMVSLFDGRVSAERVSRTAQARAGIVSFRGSVTGLVVDGEPRGDSTRARRWSAGGLQVTVNRKGEGLRVRLTRAVAGYAAGTTVVIADVAAEAVDRVAATATPTATPAPTVAPAPAPSASPEPTPSRPRITAAERLARARFVFPVYGDARVADDFGAPRRETGTHKGNDIFAAFGSPVFAVADGTLNRVGTLPISGNRLWLETARGDAFFYAHLSAFAPEAVSGRKVRAGTLLGFVGNTGDAEPTPPHVHFEIHPGTRPTSSASTGTQPTSSASTGTQPTSSASTGNRRAIDPHTVLLAWQADGEVPARGWLGRYGSDTGTRPGALVEVRDFIAGE